jgi:hypothetical protein
MAEDTAAPVATETENQEALEYWGPLFGPDKQASDKLNRLLTAIAKYIASLHHRSKTYSAANIQRRSPRISILTIIMTLLLHNSLPSTALLVEATMYFSATQTRRPLPSYISR